VCHVKLCVIQFLICMLIERNCMINSTVRYRYKAFSLWKYNCSQKEVQRDGVPNIPSEKAPKNQHIYIEKYHVKYQRRQLKKISFPIRISFSHLTQKSLWRYVRTY